MRSMLLACAVASLFVWLDRPAVAATTPKEECTADTKGDVRHGMVCWRDARDGKFKWREIGAGGDPKEVQELLNGIFGSAANWSCAKDASELKCTRQVN